MVTTTPIANFAKVDDTLWRGARPDSAGAAWLVAQGVKSVIDLELSDEDTGNFAPWAGKVQLCHLPDWEPLALAAPIEDRHIHAFLAAVKRLPKPIYVHCREGQNRTGVAVAAYRLIDKRDSLDAVTADLASYGGLWSIADLRYIRSVAERAAEFTVPA